MTRDEHACTAAAAETTGAPVMLAEGSVNVFEPFAMSVGGVAFVTHDTGVMTLILEQLEHAGAV